VAFLEREELADSWVGGEDLRAIDEAVVGEVETATSAERQVDQCAEGARGELDACGGVVDVQVEDDARVEVACPGEDRLVVLADEADGAVDDLGTALAEELGRGMEEVGELFGGT